MECEMDGMTVTGTVRVKKPLYGLFTLPDLDSDSDLDSKPDGYIVLYRNIHTGSDPDPDPCTESFPSLLLYFNQGITA